MTEKSILRQVYDIYGKQWEADEKLRCERSIELYRRLVSAGHLVWKAGVEGKQHADNVSNDDKTGSE